MEKKIYIVYTVIYGHSYYEDPKCPWNWRNSGCYDIDIYNITYLRYTTLTSSEEKAKELFEQMVKDSREKEEEGIRKQYPENAERILKYHDFTHDGEEIIGIFPSDYPGDSYDEDEISVDETWESKWTETEQEASTGEAMSIFNDTKHILPDVPFKQTINTFSAEEIIKMAKTSKKSLLDCLTSYLSENFNLRKPESTPIAHEILEHFKLSA